MCPQCTAEDAHEEGPDDMAKTTVHGGPSDVNQEGGEQEWAGTSTSTSSEPEQTTSGSSEPADQSPAPTTENLSSPDQTEGSTAPSTDGASESTSTSADQADPYDGWTKEDLQAELADREKPVSGNKAELVARLREDDAAKAAEVNN
jgi:hypothetical protein